jgi:hypothetical protein
LSTDYGEAKGSCRQPKTKELKPKKKDTTEVGQMNKERLLEEIDRIPLFVKNEIAVKKDGEYHDQEKLFAICEENSTEAIAAVSNLYNVVQFKEIWKPTINQIPQELKGSLAYYKGFGILDIFPEGQEFKDDRNNQFGIVFLNSVDKTCSVMVKFSVMHNGNILSIPQRIAGLKKAHSNKEVLNITTSYLNTIVKVKEMWKTIVEKFPQYSLDETQLGNILSDLKMPDDMKAKIKGRFELCKKANEVSPELKRQFNLWDLFNTCIDYVSSKSYKSDIHRRKRLDAIIDQIITYSFTLAI